MSNSGGVNVSKNRLIIGLSLALAICITWIGYGLLKSAEYERQADNNRAEYSKYTRKKIVESCVGISNVEAIKCRYQAFDARHEYSYNQSDLVAQRKSALWAYIMGAAAVIGIALSAVGVWLVKATFDATNESNRIAKAAGDAAQEDAGFSRQAIVRNERAIIAVLGAESFVPEDFSERDFAVALVVKNDGRSNAYTTRIEYRLAEEAIYHATRFRKAKMEFIITPAAQIRIPQFRLRRPRSYPYFLIGRLIYTTIYHAEFSSYFCLRIEGMREEDALGGDINGVMHNNISCRSIPTNT
jgi:hypothetical protein